MIKIGLAGSESMHALAFAQACNKPLENGRYLFPDVRVAAVWGMDDRRQPLKVKMAHPVRQASPTA